MRTTNASLLCLALLGCSDPRKPTDTGSSAPISSNRTVTNNPDMAIVQAVDLAPPVDQDKVWNDKVTELVTSYQKLPDPNQTLAMASFFQPTPETLACYIREITWRNDEQPLTIPKLTYELSTEDTDPKTLENWGQHYTAGMVYAREKKFGDVDRCIKELEKKFEWNVVAELALHSRNHGAFQRATAALLKSRQHSRLAAIVYKALALKNVAWAYEIAREIPESLDDNCQLVFLDAGKPSFFYTRLAREIDSACQYGDDDGPDNILRNIAFLGRRDRAAGEMAARKYLSCSTKDRPVRVALTYCNGECNPDFYPLPAAIEFFQFIRTEPELRQQYFAASRAWMEKNKAKDDGYSGFEEANLNRLFEKIRATKDAELIEHWVGNLEAMYPHQPFAREIGRMILGKPVDVHAQGLDPLEIWQLEWLSGKMQTVPRIDHTANSETIGRLSSLLLCGTIKAEHLSSAWKTLGLPAVKTIKPIESMDRASALEVVHRFEQDNVWDKAEEVWIGLVGGGYKGPWTWNKKDMGFLCGHSPRLALTVALQGLPDPRRCGQRLLAQALTAKTDASVKDADRVHEHILALVHSLDGSESALAKTDALLKGPLEALRKTSDQSLYEEVICSLKLGSRFGRRALKIEHWYNDELARRAANDIASAARLGKLLEQLTERENELAKN